MEISGEQQGDNGNEREGGNSVMKPEVGTMGQENECTGKASSDPVEMGKTEWMGFGAWLEAQRRVKCNESDVMEETRYRPGESSGSVMNMEDHRVQTQREPLMDHRRQGRENSGLLSAKDCRIESHLLSGNGASSGHRSMSILLSAPGVPLQKCPLLPAKMAGALLNALYEPVIEIEVGVLTRSLESPTRLAQAQELGSGTISLWLLPDDSAVSLVYQSKRQMGANESKTSFDVYKKLNSGLFDQDLSVKNLEVSTWEELARFPRMREGDDPVVTIHMLKGDASGRAFYILPGSETEPPGYKLSESTERQFNDFSGSNKNVLKKNERRFYFWLSDPDLETGLHNLGKLKSYIKRPPTLSKRAGVPEPLLEKVASWIQQLDGSASKSVPDFVRKSDSPSWKPKSSLDLLGGVLSKQMPVLSCTSIRMSNGIISSTLNISANASAMFKDRKFDIVCPCQISVCCMITLEAQTEGNEDAKTENEFMLKATCKARSISQTAAKSVVEIIGKRRVEEYACEDLIHSLRSERSAAKADRQRKLEIEERRIAAEDAKPLIQRAVASAVLGKKIPEEVHKFSKTTKDSVSTNTEGRCIAFSTCRDEDFTAQPGISKPEEDDTGKTQQHDCSSDGECSSKSSFKGAEFEDFVHRSPDVQEHEPKKITIHDLAKVFEKK